jgi:hypothetical protein
MRRPGKGREARFKLRHFGAHDEAPRIEHGGNAPIKLWPDQLLLRHDIKQLNGARFAHQAQDPFEKSGVKLNPKGPSAKA